MRHIGQESDWEGGWGSPPFNEHRLTQPKPKNETDDIDVLPSNSEPASSISPRQIGGVAMRPYTPQGWE